MKLIVGLGNFGEEHKGERHNVGFIILDTLVSQISNFQFPISKQDPNFNVQILQEDWKYSKNADASCFTVRLNKEKVEFIKPRTMMNNSGVSVAYVRNKYKIPNENIYVIHDDLDIKIGDYKIQKGKGPKDHNGLNSVYENLGTKDFWHVRVGIDNNETRLTENGSRVAGETYVLQKFTDSENQLLEDVMSRIINDLSDLLT